MMEEEGASSYLNDAQVIAACDESGNTVVNEDLTVMIGESGPVEVNIINIDENMLLSELDSIKPTEMILSDIVPVTGTSSAVTDVTDQAQLLMSKYLSGELSFSEYVAQVDSEEEYDIADDKADDSDYRASKETESKSRKKKEEMDSEESQLQKRGRRKGVPVVKKLPPVLQGLMGEANLRFARREWDDAVTMCLEVVRQAPTHPEPFRTLSMLYEEMGDTEKALQFAFIAAHLSPSDSDEWVRLAEAYLEQGDHQQALKCYTKAVNANPSNLELHQRRLELLEGVGSNEQQLLQAYTKMLVAFQPEQGEQCISLATTIARAHYASGHVNQALRTLSLARRQFPSHFSSEHLNLLLELLIAAKKYPDILEALKEHYNMPVDGICVNSQVPLDIKVKLGVALIHLKMDATPICNQLKAVDANEFGDLFLDIAEALMENEEYGKAAEMLELLIHSRDYSLAGVWLQYAECNRHVEKYDTAIEAYKKVIELAPQHFEARMKLSSLFQKLGRKEEALETVTQEAETIIDPSLLYERCHLLLNEQHYDEFIEAAKLLFSRHFKTIRSRNDALSACGTRRWDPEDYDEPEAESDTELEFAGSSIKAEDEFQLFRIACDLLYERKRLVELERLCISSLTSKIFRKRADFFKECRFLALQACMARRDSYLSYTLARQFLLSNFNSSRMWNLFAQVMMQPDDIRHNRFLMRLMMKNPDNLCISLLNGHACLAAGTYKYALNEYLSVFRQEPSNPLAALMAGLVFVHMACQKYSAGKHTLVNQACSFLATYQQLRGECQESYYNMGRAMHQLGLFPAALHYYEKALSFPVVRDVKKGSDLDLRREIAFNIALIYRSSGALDMARMYLYKYITV